MTIDEAIAIKNSGDYNAVFHRIPFGPEEEEVMVLWLEDDSVYSTEPGGVTLAFDGYGEEEFKKQVKYRIEA